MSSIIADVDHLLTYVRSLEAAGRVYGSLGFTLTPTSEIAAMGLANRLALLRTRTAGGASFIELMSVADPPKLPPPMRPLLRGDEGVKSMVLLTPDAHAAHADLVARGYQFAPPVHVKREWVLSPTQSLWPEFDVLLPVQAPLAFNACRYHNAEPYRRREWTGHANTAEFLHAALAVATDPEATVRYYEALLHAPARCEPDGSLSITPGHTALRIYSPRTFEEAFDAPAPPFQAGAGYAGFDIEVRDLAACRRTLEQNGVPFAQSGPRVIVRQEAACGNLVVFSGVSH